MTHKFNSLVDMLRHRALYQGNSRAYTFLTDGETENATLTYSQLDRRARVIAAALVDRGTSPGDRVILLYPPGLDFITAFFGALYAGVIAVPCYPPHRLQLARSLPRLTAILANAAPSVVLCTAEVAALSAWVAQTPVLAAVPWVVTDTIGDDAAGTWKEPDVGPSTLAFLQYTSGSTASPRGVMVTHGNLLHNLATIHHVEENDAGSVSVSWLPVIHDMGLIEGVLEPAYAGYPAYLMSPANFLQRPVHWLRAITKYRATNSGGPNFAYDLCTRKINADQRATLDLSSWRVAYNGAEPIRSETLTAFFATFRDCGFRWKSFYPVYGLAESTLVVTSGHRTYEPIFLDADASALGCGHIEETSSDASRQVTLVSSGPPAPFTRVLIVNPDTCRRCEPREIGEIWLSSPSVTKGYWRRDEETSQTFGGMLADDGSGPYLRTGDLGVIIDDQLFVAGRLKDLLIVRGFKHYPQDLELTVERQHPAIRPGCAAVFALAVHDEHIAVAAELDLRRLDITRTNTSEFVPSLLREGDGERARAISELIDRIRRAIAEIHGVQLHTVAFLKPGALPKTTSGKIRHRACSQALSGGQLAEVARWIKPDTGPSDFVATLQSATT